MQRENVYLMLAIVSFLGAIGMPAYSAYVGAFSIPALFATVGCFILCIFSVIQLIGVWFTEIFKPR
jgi:hypothetical protein